MNMRKYLSLILSLGMTLSGAGCKSDTANSKLLGGVALDTSGTGSTPTTGTVSSYFSNITNGSGATASAQTGTFPAANGGPTITSVSGGSSMINGGTSQIILAASAPISQVFVAASNTTVSAPGAAGASTPDVAGYYVLTLPIPASAITLYITASQSLADTSFIRVFSVADANGLVGAPSNSATTLTTVGTGDVQVSLSWNTATDVDLHVVDPSNNEVYYGNKTVSSGGTLDLDSNAGCSLDNKNNENITWPTGSAPSGVYKVRVDYWSSCSISGSTSYTVTVTVSGTIKTFSGTLTGSGDSGGAGAGTLVTTFTKASTGVTFSAPDPHEAPGVFSKGIK